MAYTELLGRIADIYHRALANSPLAREWLAARGVGDTNLLERFRVGWSEGTLVPMARGKVLADLKLLGILEADGRERFSGQVVVPVHDDEDRVIQLAAYAKDGSLDWLLPETPAWWNGKILRSSREVTVIRDPMAAMALIAKGETTAVIAPAGPGLPLGQAAKDALAAHAPTVRLVGCDELRGELEVLGVAIEGATKKPPAGAADGALEREGDGFAVEFPRRLRFAVHGLSQDSPRHLRASIRVYRRAAEGVSAARTRVHLDTLDLYHARSRSAFAKTAACLLGEDPVAMEENLSKIVALAEDFLRKREAPAPVFVMGSDEREEALSLLRDPKFPERVAEDLTSLGYVGEDANKRVAYLASLSRKLEDPLSILVVSRSASGKSTLADTVANLAPPEDVLRFTRLTAQTLYYQKPDSLRHKLVVIEEEKGVEDAAYALRILQSARKLSLSTAAGKGDARTREVKGPVSLFVTTTRTDLDEETAGRFVTLAVDESKEQTQAILAAQRAAEAGPPGDRDRILRVHQNAQRLLAPVRILNPFAPQLTFPDDRLSARRDHRKYLGLIRAIAFSRQHQRNLEEGAIRVTVGDIDLANRLAHHALGQSLFDLTPPSRRLLVEIRDWLGGREEGAKFSQRELRDRVGWKRSQLALHVRELVETEYLVSHVTGPGRRTRFALDWDGQGLDGEKFYRGLLDTTRLAELDTSGSLPTHFRGTSGNRKARLGASRDVRGPESGPSIRTSGEKQS